MDLSRFIEYRGASLDRIQTREKVVEKLFAEVLGWDTSDKYRVIRDIPPVESKAKDKVDFGFSFTGATIDFLVLVDAMYRTHTEARLAHLSELIEETDSKYGILTNGLTWIILRAGDTKIEYSFVLDDTECDDDAKSVLSAFSFNNQDLSALEAALQTVRENVALREIVSKELLSPSNDVAFYFWKKLHPGAPISLSEIDAFKNRVSKIIGTLLDEKTPATLVSRKRRRQTKTGAIVDAHGNEIRESNLKKTYEKYLTELSAFEEAVEALKELRDKGKAMLYKEERVSATGQILTIKLSDDLYAYTALANAQKEKCLKHISDRLSLGAKFVYDV